MKTMIKYISLVWLLVMSTSTIVYSIDSQDKDAKIDKTQKDQKDGQNKPTDIIHTDEKIGMPKEDSDNGAVDYDALLKAELEKQAELDKDIAALDRYYEELAQKNNAYAYRAGNKKGSLLSANIKVAKKTGGYLLDRAQFVAEQALLGLAVTGLQAKVREYWHEYTTEKARPLTEKDFAYIPKEVSDVISYIQSSANLNKTTSTAAKKVKAGILMSGAAGTGKTHNAQLIAGVLGAEFSSISATQLQDKYMGESARKVRNVFEKARKSKKLTVIFIDEIHVCGTSGAGADDDHKHIGDIHNALLTELDGAGKDNSNIVFIGATNHPESVESALKQRMPKIINLAEPTKEEREKLLKFYFEKTVHVLTDKDFAFFAGYWRTGGWNARAFPNLVEQSKEVAIEQGKSAIDRICVLKALSKVQKTFKEDIVSKENIKKVSGVITVGQSIMGALNKEKTASILGALKGLLGLAA